MYCYVCLVWPITRLTDPGSLFANVMHVVGHWNLTVHGDKLIHPELLQWAFYIGLRFEFRTDVAADVCIYLAGWIPLLVCKLRFCICILSALFPHFCIVSLYLLCVIYVCSSCVSIC